MHHFIHRTAFVCALMINLALPALADTPVNERDNVQISDSERAYKGLIIKPEIKLETRYNDNVRPFSNSDEDISLATIPGLSIQKNFGAHSIKGFISGEIERFRNLQSENKENLEGEFIANINPNSKWSITPKLKYQNKTRSRDILNRDNITEEPEHAYRLEGSLAVKRTLNRLSVTLMPYITDIQYDNGIALSDGISRISFNDENRTDIGAHIRTEYELLRGTSSDQKPEHLLFMDLNFADQDYERLNYENGSYNGANGDNSRYTFLAGLQSTYKGLLTASLGAGFTKTDYDDSSVENITYSNFNADITAHIRPKWDITFNGYRKLNQDNNQRQGLKDTKLDLSTDYELQHNLFLHAGASTRLIDFIDTVREDEHYTGELGLRYQHSPYLESGLSLHYFDRQSSIASQEYDRTSIIFSVTGKI